MKAREGSAVDVSSPIDYRGRVDTSSQWLMITPATDTRRAPKPWGGTEQSDTCLPHPASLTEQDETKTN